MPNPQYIDRGGELVFQPPYLSENLHHFDFICAADITKLQAMCDKYFNTPLKQPGRFVAGGPFVLFVFADLPVLKSTTAPYSQMGWFSEQEAAIWVLVLDKQEKRYFWYVPYIWVDNPYAMVMGREVYGFPKAFGKIVMPPSLERPDLFALDTLAFRQYDPNVQVNPVRLIGIERLPNVQMPHGLAGAFDDMETIGKAIMKFMGDGLSVLGNMAVALHGLEDLFHMHIPTVFLKQIRDVVNPSQAAFQSIVESPASVTKFHLGKIYSEAFDIHIEDCVSHPLRAEFGLAPSGPIRPSLSFSLHLDFQIGAAVQTIITA